MNSQCVANKDCTSNYCRNGRCEQFSRPFAPCRPNALAACPRGYYCNPLSKICVPDGFQMSSPCLLDADCAADRYCHSGSCLLRKGHGELCSAANQCEDGYTCVHNLCLPLCLPYSIIYGCRSEQTCQRIGGHHVCIPTGGFSWPESPQYRYKPSTSGNPQRKKSNEAAQDVPTPEAFLMGFLLLIVSIAILAFITSIFKMHLAYRKKMQEELEVGIHPALFRSRGSNDSPPPYTATARPIIARLSGSYEPEELLPPYVPRTPPPPIEEVVEDPFTCDQFPGSNDDGTSNTTTTLR